MCVKPASGTDTFFTITGFFFFEFLGVDSLFVEEDLNTTLIDSDNFLFLFFIALPDTSFGWALDLLLDSDAWLSSIFSSMFTPSLLLLANLLLNLSKNRLYSPGS